MLYGIILDNVRDYVIFSNGLTAWKRIVRELKLPSETFDLYERYDGNIMMNIGECLVDILHEGTRDNYLQLFGENFFRYCNKLGYGTLFRVAARTLREFFFVIDQLHDSNRFTFSKMRNPIFHVTEEDDTGITLEYKSVRRGLTHFAIGILSGAAKTLFNETNVRVYVRNDLSTSEYTHMAIWVQFDNKTYQPRSLSNPILLPTVTGPTFFKVFPFSILMDSSLHIRHLGSNIRKVFPIDSILVGKPFDEVFRLLRPDIHIEWDKILCYGRNIVFLVENRLPLRDGPSGRIRLKGQMKYIENKNILWFLCHPVLGSTDDMTLAGLRVVDLNLFDSTGELLVANMHLTEEMEDVTEKLKVCGTELDYVRTQLLQYRKRNRNMLCTMMPKHIVSMMQSRIPAFSLNESYPLVTVMFAYIANFRMSAMYLKPIQIMEILDEVMNLFDDIAHRFDIFKIKTKMDASYMFASGLHDRSYIIPQNFGSSMSLKLSTDGEEENEKDSVELNPTEIIAYLAFELLRASEHLINPMTRKPFGIKIGFHAGAAIGGIIGDEKLKYCLFGETVTVARQIMTTGEINRIHISQTAYQYLIENNRFTFEPRVQSDVKDENTTTTYWLTGMHRRPSTTGITKGTKFLRYPYNAKLC